MKFYVNSSELSEAMNIVSKALTNKKSIPVLEGIKIEAEGDTVKFTATDLDLFIEKKIKAEVFLEGQAVIPGRFFTEYVRKLSEFERIEFEKLDNRRILVRYGEAKIEIQCFEEDTYPEILSIANGNSFKIPEKDLKELLEKTIFSVAVDDSRPILKGCLFETEDDTLSAVGLDGYRIAICKKAISEKKGDAKVVVPGRNLQEICKIFTDSDNAVTVVVKDSNIKFDLGHTVIVSRLLEGEYVHYKGIVPSNFKTSVVIKIGEISSCLERTALIARNKNNNSVKLLIQDNQICISADSESASGQEIVVVKQEGDDLKIAFNSKYLQEALSRIKEDYAKIEFNKANTPAMIHPIEGEEYRYIILPVRQLG